MSSLSVAFLQPASKITHRTGSNPLCGYIGHGSGTTSTNVDGRNFLTSVGGVAASQDARGNLLSSPTGGSSAPVFTYTAENRLSSGPGSTLYYDPLGRLRHVSGSGTDFVHDGNQIIQELGAYGAGNRRFWVPGPNPDERILWVEGTSERRWLHADERGSVVAVSDNAGNLMAINAYDEYGRSQTTASSSGQLFGRFGYTGQAWLPEIGVYYYKARMYDPANARFLQSDRLGYVDGLNMWAYVGGDPVNRSDPTGMLYEVRPCLGSVTYCGVISASNDIVVEGHRRCGLGKICFDVSNALVLENANGITAPRMVFNTDGGGGGGGGTPQSDPVCRDPLTAPGNRGQTISSRRAQVRAEVTRAMDLAVRTGGDPGAMLNAEVGRNAARLAPGGSWIRGQKNPAEGNRLYGAITAEFGIPLVVAIAFGDIAEIIDDAFGYIGIRPYDGNFGPDSPEAKRQIRQGAGC